LALADLRILRLAVSVFEDILQAGRDIPGPCQAVDGDGSVNPLLVGRDPKGHGKTLVV